MRPMKSTNTERCVSPVPSLLDTDRTRLPIHIISIFHSHKGDPMRVIHTIQMATMCLLLIATVVPAATAGGKGRSSSQVSALDRKTEDRARYVIKIAGCNDCHTTGYAEVAGKIAEKDWLKGDSIGWRGPWGTTYASNLRLYMRTLSEDQWIKVSPSA